MNKTLLAIGLLIFSVQTWAGSTRRAVSTDATMTGLGTGSSSLGVNQGFGFVWSSTQNHTANTGFGAASTSQKIHMSSGTILVDGNVNNMLDLSGSSALMGVRTVNPAQAIHVSSGTIYVDGNTVNAFIAPGSTQKIGIGTGSPAQSLHVSSGTVYIDGNITNAIIAPVSTQRIGVGTANPATALHLSSATVTIDGNTADSIRAAGTALVGAAGSIAAGNLFQVGGGTLAVTSSGHVKYSGTVPTLSSCGTGTIDSGSNDMRGSVTFAGGAQTSCVINFINTGGVATPFCTCSDDSAVTTVKCLAGSGTLTVSIAVAANDTISYICAW